MVHQEVLVPSGQTADLQYFNAVPEADDEISFRRHSARDIRRRRRAATTNAHRAYGQKTRDKIERIFRSAETGQLLADEGAIGKRAGAIRKRHDQQLQPEGPRRDRIYRNGAYTLHE